MQRTKSFLAWFFLSSALLVSLSVAAEQAAPDQNCVIKGNISYRTGEKIYHLPGQKYYNATVISREHGERWFCSESAAKNAGWRKAKV